MAAPLCMCKSVCEILDRGVVDRDLWSVQVPLGSRVEGVGEVCTRSCGDLSVGGPWA